MIDISGHFRELRREIGFEDHDRPLLINCCGYQKFMTRDLARNRPQGRLDHQLIYILAGSGTFLLDGEEREISAGNILLYPPGVPQVYSYYHQDRPEVCWIHFTGSRAEEILEGFRIHSGPIGENRQIRELFREMIVEMQLKKPCFEAVAGALFLKLLALIHRAQAEPGTDPRLGPRLDRLLIALNQTYQKAWTVQDMAGSCGLSVSYFSHFFKESMGIAPMQYLTGLRIGKAKELLLGNDLPISSVASLLGYEDPLYFSKVFKRATGQSPREYRRSPLPPGGGASAGREEGPPEELRAAKRGLRRN